MNASPSPPDPQLRKDGNVFLAFEESLKFFPSANTTIFVERIGTPATWTIATRPRTSNDLYSAVLKLHGRNPETTYEITFRDGGGNGGKGQATMPSTMDGDAPAPPQSPAAAQAPQPPPQSYAQPPFQAPPPQATDPVTVMQEAFKLFLQAQPPQAPTTPQPSQPQPPTADPVATLQRAFQLFEQMRSQQAQPPPSPPPPPVVQVTPPPPTDPVEMMREMLKMVQQAQSPTASQAPAHPPTDPVVMLREVFKLVQQAQPQQAAPAAVSPPAQSMSGMPPFEPPPGMMFVPGFGFVPVEKLFSALGGTAAAPSAAPSTGPYRPRYPGPDPSAAPPEPRPPYPPPARPQTPSQQLREAASVFRDFRQVADELGIGGQPAEPPPPEEDDSPVRVIDMGPAKGVINRDNGTLRGFETFMANLPDIIKGVGDIRTHILKERRENQERRQQQLPPGYVMAGPDYRPPEGFVAVPIDQIPQEAQPAQTLPEPPAEMPPPIAERPPATPPRRAWGMPEVPR